MWNELIVLSEDKIQVIAKLNGDKTIAKEFSEQGLNDALVQIGARKYFVDQDAVKRFINCAKEMKHEAYDGIVVALQRDAQVEVVLTEQDMLASMLVTGAYGGRGLHGSELVQALADAQVVKGINKLALKKVLLMSNTLKPGETFTQPVARGKEAVQGQDSQFIALVEDVSKRILAPQERKSDDKIDMRNLGETVTVGENEPVMRRQPATEGEAGYTVQGKVIAPRPGINSELLPGRGTHLSPEDPNLLLASQSGMPIIKSKTIDVDNALCLNNVSIATGHVKFKGNVVIAGDVEPGMVVRATGSVTVGGFIESADVQAQGNIEVGKGIIGHTVSEGEAKSCVVKSGVSIKANYAQFCELQAAENIQIAVHCMSAEVRCGGDLLVLDDAEKQGTLSGGVTKVGGKVTCLNLGVEGDTAMNVEAFARFAWYKDRMAKHKEQYKLAQEETMDIIRRELEFKKRPKAERSDEEELEIDNAKDQANAKLEKVKSALDILNDEFEIALENNVVDVKGKVFTHVSVQFGDERVTTKRVHGPSIFSFNQYEIQLSSKLDEEEIGI